MKLEYSLYRITNIEREMGERGKQCMMANKKKFQCKLKAAYCLFNDKLPVIFICGTHLKELRK